MRRTASILALVLPLVLLAGSTAAAGAQAPQGRTYFVWVMGLNDDTYDADVDCLTFDATEACSSDGEVCLAWQRAEGGVQARKQSGFSFETEIDDDGLIITMDGQGRVDDRGKGSSISMVARAAALDLQLNFVVSGRQARRSRCLRMVEDFYAARAGGR